MLVQQQREGWNECERSRQRQSIDRQLPGYQSSGEYQTQVFILSAKLPKWFGERPGKKPGDPESPDDEDEGPAEVPPGAEEEEEEEEEDEEEEEEEQM